MNRGLRGFRILYIKYSIINLSHVKTLMHHVHVLYAIVIHTYCNWFKLITRKTGERLSSSIEAMNYHFLLDIQIIFIVSRHLNY